MSEATQPTHTHCSFITPAHAASGIQCCTGCSERCCKAGQLHLRTSPDSPRPLHHHYLMLIWPERTAWHFRTPQQDTPALFTAPRLFQPRRPCIGLRVSLVSLAGRKDSTACAGRHSKTIFAFLSPIYFFIQSASPSLALYPYLPGRSDVTLSSQLRPAQWHQTVPSTTDTKGAPQILWTSQL